MFAGRPYGALDSGFNSVDSGDKRWLGNEVRRDLCFQLLLNSLFLKTQTGFNEASRLFSQPSEELSELPSRVAEISKDQRRGGGGPALPNGTCESFSVSSAPCCRGHEASPCLSSCRRGAGADRLHRQLRGGGGGREEPRRKRQQQPQLSVHGLHRETHH